MFAGRHEQPYVRPPRSLNFIQSVVESTGLPIVAARYMAKRGNTDITASEWAISVCAAALLSGLIERLLSLTFL